MNILILEDEPRNAKRLIRLLNDIDRTFIVEGPLASIKETVEFFQSGKTTNLILADIRLTDGLSFEALKYAPATIPIIFSRPLKSAHLRNIVRKQYPADFFNKPQKSPHGSFEVVCGGS
ncbi:hypothetical protein CE91St1_15910 [Parabacteroides goldsteinii]|nr:hypothetical protein CE91St1_15910 [Parabacteroides goldsteinii]GKG78454.1 hypothetical protein CE91St2_16460 [Parabacteroides goldsteinii]